MVDKNTVTHIFRPAFETDVPLALEAQELFAAALRHPAYMGRELNEGDLQRLHGHIAMRLGVELEEVPSLIAS